MDERLKLCFSCYDIQQTGGISKVDLSCILQSIYEFFCPSIDSNDIDTLAEKVVRGMTRKKQISFDNFAKIILAIPVVSLLVIDKEGNNDEPYTL